MQTRLERGLYWERAWKLVEGCTKVAMLIHDWGYWGCGDMDGEEGELHPIWAANLCEKYLDLKDSYFTKTYSDKMYYKLCCHHSRFFSSRYGEVPSRLCWADKLGTAMMPTWLWVLLGTLTGEIKEYMSVQKHRDFIQEKTPLAFFKVYKEELVPKLLKENIDHKCSYKFRIKTNDWKCSVCGEIMQDHGDML